MNAAESREYAAAVDAYTAMIGLATAADADHAGKQLDRHANLHSAITHSASSHAELILTLPADDLRHAAHIALDLIKATGHRPLRLEVLLAENYDRRDTNVSWTRRTPTVYTDAALVAELRRVAGLPPDGVLTKRGFEARSTLSAATLRRRFGTWRQALEAAGLGHRYSGQAVTARMRRKRSRRFTNDELIADLRKVRTRTGRPYVTRADLHKYAANSRGVYIARFGSWPAAVAAAGLTIAPQGRTWSDDDLAANLRHLIQLYGRTPTMLEMNRPPSTISLDTYRRRFGSLDHARDALDIT